MYTETTHGPIKVLVDEVVGVGKKLKLTIEEKIGVIFLFFCRRNGCSRRLEVLDYVPE